MKLENMIYCSDNPTWLKRFPHNCVDLIVKINNLQKKGIV